MIKLQLYVALYFDFDKVGYFGFKPQFYKYGFVINIKWISITIDFGGNSCSDKRLR